VAGKWQENTPRKAMNALDCIGNGLKCGRITGNNGDDRGNYGGGVHDDGQVVRMISIPSLAMTGRS
jgi:hypothetical protein